MESKAQTNLLKIEEQHYLKSQQENIIPKHRQILSQAGVQEMFDAQSRLEDFMEEIGGLRESEIRTDVTEHCDRSKLSFLNYISVESVEKMVKSRIEKMIKNKRIKKNWSEQDIKILIWIVSKYAEFKKLSNIEKDLYREDWKVIASLIPGVEAENCMFKWLSLKKNNLTQHGWGDRQSQLLESVVRKYGEKDWNLVSQKLYFMNQNSHKIYRCAKQCRQHWNCYLNPNLKKGPWTKQQDLQLLNIIKKNKCQKRWAEMVCQFKGRTENALKNRYTLIMEKQMKLHPKSQKLTQLQIIEQYLEKSYVQQFVDDNQKDSKTIEEGMRTRRMNVVKNHTYKTSTLSEEIDDLRSLEKNSRETIKHEEAEKSKAQAITEELPSVENIEIITLTPQQLRELAERILSEQADFVPCTFNNNQLKRISRI